MLNPHEGGALPLTASIAAFCRTFLLRDEVYERLASDDGQFTVLQSGGA